MKTLHFAIILTLCIVVSSTIPLQHANASVPLVIITIQGGANSPSCGNACIIPQNITVDRGTAVQWINKDLVPHNIVSGNPGDKDNGLLFNSGPIWVGNNFIHNFNDVGTFHYFDPNHTWDTGIIQVTNEAYPILLSKIMQGNPRATLDSPLKQFKSGIQSENVQCKTNLVLTFRLEDDTPACVKPDTKIKLVEHGWGMMSNLILTNNTSENNCGQFYTAPGRQPTSIPVLLMDSNSTACARLTFTVDRNPDISLSRIHNTSDGLIIGNYNVSRHVSLLSVSSGTDYTHSFQITFVPKTVDLTNLPIGSNFTVTYIIKPLSNATGFYDYSIPWLACERYPLAVGYASDHVNYSNFSYIDPASYPCASVYYTLTAVEISGMSYKYIILPVDLSNR